MPWKGGGPAESPAQSTITASRPRAKMANGDSSRIHRYLRLLPHEAKFLSQMKGVETDSLVATRLMPAGHTSRGAIQPQSNRLDTDSSAAVRPIASPISVAMERTRMLRATRA